MRITNEGTAITGVLGTVATPGTVTGDSIDWSPYYQSTGKMVASIGAVSAGTATVYFQGGTASGDTATAYGTIQAAGAAAGTATYELDMPSITTRYVNAEVVMAGGTVTPVAVTFIAEPITST